MSACGRDTQPTAAPAPRAGATGGAASHDRFLELHRPYRADYQPASSPAELAEWSDVVAFGRLQEVREGRIIGTSPDDPLRVEHLVYVLRLTDVLKGQVKSDVAGVEVPKPSYVPAAAFDDAAPVGAKVLIYARREPSPAHGAPSIEPPEPLAGAPIVQFTTPQGFLIQIDGRVVHPLEWSGHGQPLFKTGDPEPTRLSRWAPPGGRGGR